MGIWPFGKKNEDAKKEQAQPAAKGEKPASLAALLGGVPLMLGSGAGSEIRQPLGYAIVGGLLLSVLGHFRTAGGAEPDALAAHEDDPVAVPA